VENAGRRLVMAGDDDDDKLMKLVLIHSYRKSVTGLLIKYSLINN